MTKSIDDILKDYIAEHADGFFGGGKPSDAVRIRDETKAALYAAVVGQKPEYPYLDYGKEGFDACNKLWLANIAALFGVDDSGLAHISSPKAINNQSDTPEEGAYHE